MVYTALSSFNGCSHFTDIDSHAPEVGQGSKCRTWGFCHILTLLPPGASIFHKHMSSFSIELWSWIFNVHGNDVHFIECWYSLSWFSAIWRMCQHEIYNNMKHYLFIAITPKKKKNYHSVSTHPIHVYRKRF